MALRRSLIGSWRAPSSSLGPSGIAAESSFRSETAQSGRDTPVAQKKTRIEEVRPPPPDLDRTVDLLVVSDLALVSEDNLSNGIRGCHPLFLLPMGVRRRIYGFCFPIETRPITLSPRFATRAAFEDEYFASPWDVLEPISGGLCAFSALRRDLYAYFWTEYHFHATFNPFSGPKFSPLSHVWLFNYLDIIQNLTVEADLTRFGCSVLNAAPQFGYSMKSET